jgi:hypothetical protein
VYISDFNKIKIVLKLKFTAVIEHFVTHEKYPSLSDTAYIFWAYLPFLGNCGHSTLISSPAFSYHSNQNIFTITLVPICGLTHFVSAVFGLFLGNIRISENFNIADTIGVLEFITELWILGQNTW